MITGSLSLPFSFFPPRQLFACLFLSHLPYYLRAWNRLATVRVPRPPYIYTPWPRFLMMMVQTEPCWLTATSKLLARKCPYHQHEQKFVEIVQLWTGRDLIPGRDNTGWPSSARWYGINTSILIQSLRARILEVNKQVWLADDSAGGGPTELLYNWYKLSCQEGKKCGYLVNGSKR